MQAVKDRDTGPEMAVRRAVHALGYRYRLHRRDLPGCPDIVLPRLRKIIFINGCFWHGHDCSRGSRVPKTNKEYWMTKITLNRKRDSEAYSALRDQGWQVMILWECELKKDLSAKLRGFLENPLTDAVER